MTYTYNPRPVQEKDKVRAWAWYRQHREHVDRMVRLRSPLRFCLMYPPSGSDCLRPELWKPSHWRWLLGETRDPDS